MKILHIITQSENGGAQKNVLDIVSGLRGDYNFDIHVAVGAMSKESDTWLFDELVSNKISSKNLHEIKSLTRAISPAKDLMAFFEIYKLLKKENFDLVHLHSSKMEILGSVAAKIAGTKTIFTVHGFYFTEPMSKLKKYIFIFIEWLASFFIDEYICVSKNDLSLGRKYKIIRRARGIVVYNGIEENKKYTSETLVRSKIFEIIKIKDTNQKIVGTIANLYDTKGLIYLIEAASIIIKENINCIFIIFGEGPERSTLEKEIKKLGLESNFFLAGYISEASLFTKGFDIFVLPSLKEGLPYTILEAANSGVPIVATSVGGIPEIAKQLNLQIVSPGNSKKLSEKILNLLKPRSAVFYKTKLPKEFFVEKQIEKVYNIYLTK